MNKKITKITAGLIFIIAIFSLSGCGKLIDSILEGNWTEETLTTGKPPEKWEFTDDQKLIIENISNETGRTATGYYSLSSKGLTSYLTLSNFGKGLNGKFKVERFSDDVLVIVRVEYLEEDLDEGKDKTAGAYVRKELYK